MAAEAASLFIDDWSWQRWSHTAVSSGEGLVFTLVDIDGEVYPFRIRLEQAPVAQIYHYARIFDYTPDSQFTVPNSGPDTYFRVFGARELGTVIGSGGQVQTQGNAYVTPSQHDSAYAMGFQTVFFIPNDSADASSLTPVDGNPMNFSSGPLAPQPLPLISVSIYLNILKTNIMNMKSRKRTNMQTNTM